MRCYVTRFTTCLPCCVPGKPAWLLPFRTALHNARLTHSAPIEKQSLEDTPLRVITPVEKLIAGSIKATGPISIARYMQLCLGHPTEGYYMKRDVFGEKGDFITSPEISQAFGELLAVWLMSEWQRNGQPSSTRLIELGPGRGTLMSDMLRAFASFKGMAGSVRSVHMVDNSRAMRQLQEKALSEFTTQNQIQLSWHDDLEDIQPDPNTFTMVVAHEFFDAMPIHMLEKADDGYREIMVDLARRGELDEKADIHQSSYSFRFAKSPPNTPLAKLLSQSSTRYAALPSGSRIEVSPQASAVAQTVARLIGGEGGGAALIVDYGDAHAFGSSLRAFREHKHVDLFEQPGMCDITANVDFAALHEAMETIAHAHGPITQRHFLMSMGLVQRLDSLMKAAGTTEQKSSIAHAARRLVDSTAMGSEYKFMAVTGKPEVPYPFEGLDDSLQ